MSDTQDALAGQAEVPPSKHPSGNDMSKQIQPLPALTCLRENSTHLRFWFSPLGALVALILFSLKWTNWEADLSGWQIALGPWGLDLIDFPHSSPAVWLVYWFIPFTALFVLGLSIARLFGVRLRWLRFWAGLLTAGCVVIVVVTKASATLDWDSRLGSASNLNSLPVWTCALLALALCGLWLSRFPREEPAQMTAPPAGGRFSRRKALLNIGSLFVLSGAGGYLFTLLQAQMQRAIAIRFQLTQRAIAIDPIWGTGYRHMNIASVAWSPDSNFMATINDDGLQIWRVNPTLLKMKSIVAPPGGDLGQFHFREVAWSPNGHTLAVLDEGTIDLYDAQTDLEQRFHTPFTPAHDLMNSAESVSWSPDGRSLASTLQVLREPTQAFVVWEADNAQNWHLFLDNRSDVPDDLSGVPAVDSLVWSPDGQVIATVDNHQITYYDSTLAHLPDLPSGVKPSPYLQAAVRTSFSLWDVQSGERLSTYTLNAARDGAGTISALAWSPNGRYLALALAPSEYIETHGQYTRVDSSPFTERCPLLIWDVATRKIVRSCWGNHGSLTSVTWSPDGTRVAGGGSDGMVLFWNASTGVLLLTYQGFSYRYSGSSIQYLAWSPDGKLLAARGGSDSKIGVILVWNAPEL